MPRPAPPRTPRGTTPANKGRRYPAQPLSPADVRALIHACSTRSTTGIRARALIATLYRGGLRVSEALALDLPDLDLAAGTIHVRHGKGGRPRTIGIDPGAAAIIHRWIDHRAQLGHPPTGPLYVTHTGRRLGAAYVRRLLPRLADRAGVTRRVHAHALRHAHAAELAREGLPVNLIQQQLGHASLATTDRYLRHVAPVEVVRAVAARTWQA